MTEKQVSLADIDQAVAEAFGHTPPSTSEDSAAPGPTMESDIELFRSLYLSEQAARRAAHGLHNGTYGSFEEAATMSHLFDLGRTHGPLEPWKVTEVAKQRGGAPASETQLVEAEAAGAKVTQADVDSGVVVVLIGFAPVKPAEFVAFRIRVSAGRAG